MYQKTRVLSELQDGKMGKQGPTPVNAKVLEAFLVGGFSSSRPRIWREKDRVVRGTCHQQL